MKWLYGISIRLFLTLIVLGFVGFVVGLSIKSKPSEPLFSTGGDMTYSEEIVVKDPLKLGHRRASWHLVNGVPFKSWTEHKHGDLNTVMAATLEQMKQEYHEHFIGELGDGFMVMGPPRAVLEISEGIGQANYFAVGVYASQSDAVLGKEKQGLHIYNVTAVGVQAEDSLIIVNMAETKGPIDLRAFLSPSDSPGCSAIQVSELGQYPGARCVFQYSPVGMERGCILAYEMPCSFEKGREFVLSNLSANGWVVEDRHYSDETVVVKSTRDNRVLSISGYDGADDGSLIVISVLGG